MSTIKQVNKALRTEGINGALVRGDGYYYFVGPDFETCNTTSIYSMSISKMSVDQIIHEARNFLSQRFFA